MTDLGFIRSQSGLVALHIKLQPRSSRNEIGPPMGGELKIKVTAPPVDAAANQALLDLLAERLSCPRSALKIVRGHTSRHKIVTVFGLESQEAAKLLL